MLDNIISEEYTDGIIRGVEKVTKVLRPTYGGAGTNVIVEISLRPGHIATNDCQTIVQAMKFTDPCEKRALAFIQELSNRTDKMTGDNRKTTVILMEEILKEGYTLQMQKLSLKKQLDELIPFIEEEIDKQTRKITVNEVASVATTASENPETGILLQEIYQQIGPEGIIHVEGSGTYETSYEITNGIKFDMAGLLSSAMVHDEQAVKDKQKETRAVYENPYILVTQKKITTDEDINPLLKMLEDSEKKDLVIFTNDMDSGVASMLVNLHKSKRFNICIIKAPSLWQQYYFEDFALCTGATIVNDASGLHLRKLPFEALGTCDKIIVEGGEHDDGETTIIGTQDISEHMAKLEARGDDDSKLRLSWLANKTAKIRLGSNSETDLSYKRLKCNDAVRSSKLALKYGIVAGGGVCALNISKLIRSNPGGVILQHALQAPIKQIMTNFGGNHTLWHKERGFTKETFGFEENDERIKSYGFDAKRGIYGDMFEMGIIDSAQTLKSAIRNAIGIASTILTAEAYVYIPELTPQQIAYQIAMNKQYDF